MTIDEAIARYKNNAEYERTHGNLQGCLEFRQLAEWLDELEKLREQTKWIPVSESLPEEHICDDGYVEPSKSVLVQMKSGEIHIAQYWSRYVDRWLGLNYPTTDEVVAWMPLPKSYKAESED